MNAEYAEGVEPSKYIDLPNKEEDNTSEAQASLDDFELDPAKVCAIDDPDCEACQ